MLSSIRVGVLALSLIKAVYALNVTHIDIVSYGLTVPVILSALPLMSPGYDMGADHLRSEYGLNVSLTYLSSPDAKNCADLPDHLDLVYDYYYRKHLKREPFALILPGCDDLVPLGKLAREWNVPMLSCGPTSDLRSRTNFPTAVNNGPMQMSMLAEVFLGIFEQFSWFSVALLVDLGTPAPFYRMWTEALTGQLAARRNSKLVLHQQQFNSKLFIDYGGILQEASKTTASEKDMTNGEYVYFSLEPFQNQRYFSNLTWENHDADDSVALEAYRSLKQVTPCYEDYTVSHVKYNALMADLLRRTALSNYTYGPGELPNPFLFAAYESMEIFGKVINDSINNPNILFDGRLFISQIVNKTLSLPSGSVLIGEYGEKRSDYCINSLSPRTHRYEAVIRYRAETRTFANLKPDIDWANVARQPPANEPPCGYFGTAKICSRTGWTDESSILLAVLLLTGFLLIPTICFLLRAMNLHLYASTWWLVTIDCAGIISKGNSLVSGRDGCIRHLALI